MKIGIIGLGRMGGNIARRIMRAGHQAVVFDRDEAAVQKLVGDGAAGATSLDDMRSKLDSPAIYWVMLPAGEPTEQTVATIGGFAESGDIVIDGGNSFYKDDIRRAKMLAEKGIRSNAVAPGPIWTPLIPSTMKEEAVTKFGSNVPMKRAGQPAELATAYVMLADPLSSYVSGATIAVTGGKPFI